MTGPARSPRPVAVELVGPAGAGKSTLTAALRRRHPEATVDPELRDLAPFPVVAIAACVAALRLAGRRALVRGAVRDQLEMMADLELLARAVERDSSPERPFVLDQGPIFYLTRPVLANPRLERWRSAMLERWASLLSLVVWLDAADATLAGRIDTRPKHHALKGAGTDEAATALAAARAALDDAVRLLASRPDGPEVLRVDTGTLDAEAVAAVVCHALTGGPRPPA